MTGESLTIRKIGLSFRNALPRWLTQDDQQLLVFSCGLGFLTAWWLRYQGEHHMEKNRQKWNHFV